MVIIGTILMVVVIMCGVMDIIRALMILSNEETSIMRGAMLWILILVVFFCSFIIIRLG